MAVKYLRDVSFRGHLTSTLAPVGRQRAVENVVDVHDLHATMLALMGIDHHRLNVKYQGLDVRLTGVAGKVVKGIMA